MIDMKTQFDPDYCVHPGAILQEAMEENGISRANLAERLDYPLETIDDIVSGEKPITKKIAKKLGEIFTEISFEFWNALQINYEARNKKMIENQILRKENEQLKEKIKEHEKIHKMILFDLGRMQGIIDSKKKK